MRHSAVRLAAGAASVVVDPADGGRLTSLRVGDLELLGGAGDGVVEHGSFLMAPWAGRIRDGLLTFDGQQHRLPTDRTHPHAGHGLVMDRPWEVVARTEQSARLRCALDERWPFRGEVVAEVELTTDGVRQGVHVVSAQEAFPATVGWHPWFRRQLDRGSPLALELIAGAMWRRDAEGIPDGIQVPVPPGPWDDCFTDVRWPVVLHWAGALTVTIDADTDHVVVFDERPEAVCVEPQTGPPDGPNRWPRLVTPDYPLVATTTWRWSLPGAAQHG